MEQSSDFIEEVFNQDGAVATIQYVSGEAFLHCSVNKITPSLIKNLKSTLASILDKRKESGLSRPLFSYTQNARFAQMMGGCYLSSFVEEGKYFEVWMWELKQH